ncbi:G2/M phase-specific E3 ubiquitin-protein ligase-like [Tubulanus polymorphus]|uniref:G2/M phase-specific E3 ubiquitin-protein ligase-like n=1 Tax=Tubulanus polymorphus TaxID=672921 RepID=UPI003DA6A992
MICDIQVVSYVNIFVALDKECYIIAGKLVAYSVVHGGPFPQFLHPQMYERVSGGYAKIKIDDVPDTDVRAKMKATLVGCLHINSLEEAVQSASNVAHWYIFQRTNSAIEQFKSRLETLGFLMAVQENRDLMREGFLEPIHSLDANQILDMFQTPELSPEGSNKRRAESDTLAYWYDFVEHLGGLARPPPLGFDPSVCIRFRHPSDGSDEWTRNYPIANTCANILHLPVLSEYDEFQQNMLAAILSCLSFTDK